MTLRPSDVRYFLQITSHADLDEVPNMLPSCRLSHLADLQILCICCITYPLVRQLDLFKTTNFRRGRHSADLLFTLSFRAQQERQMANAACSPPSSSPGKGRSTTGEERVMLSGDWKICNQFMPQICPTAPTLAPLPAFLRDAVSQQQPSTASQGSSSTAAHPRIFARHRKGPQAQKNDLRYARQGQTKI